MSIRREVSGRIFNFWPSLINKSDKTFDDDILVKLADDIKC